jgi:hypothetical protein
MHLRHLRVPSFIPLHAARLVTVDGLHDPVDLDGHVAAIAASSAVQE